MLTNVVDIDHLAHPNSLTDEDPTLILYDFTAAFPSISRDFTLRALEAFGAPKEALQVMRAFTKTTTYTSSYTANPTPASRLPGESDRAVHFRP